MKLKIFQRNLFKQSDLVDQQQLVHDYRLLAAAMSDVFPERRDWKMVVANADIFREGTQLEKLTEQNLPLHTRDLAWLTKYTAHVVNKHSCGETVRNGNVRRFVASAAEFDHARTRYEQNVTRGMIEYQMDNFHPYCAGEYDIEFRARVLTDLYVYGVDRANAELALEQNAPLWRETAWVKAFRGYYHPENIYMGKDFFPDTAEGKATKKHQKAWVALREYQYYHKHRAIVDAAGSDTENMHMTTDQAWKLLQTNLKFHRAHLASQQHERTL